MKKRIAVIVNAALLIAAVAIYAAARSNAYTAVYALQQDGPPGPPPERVIAHMAEQLGLSDAQQAQIKEIITSEQSVIAPQQQKLADSHKQLRDATANGQFDEVQVRALATQQASAMIELIVSRERVKSKIYNVLTPDQRTKAKQMMERMGGPRFSGLSGN